MWEGDIWVAQRAARAGADIVQEGFFAALDTEMKGATDPVTQIDRKAEAAIRRSISSRFPSDNVLGEEEGGGDWRTGRVWIVDPLDGTVNFIHGIPQVAVSVALWNEGSPAVGVIIDVARNDEYMAVADDGATLNGEIIEVSKETRMGRAMVLTGYPYDRQERASAYLDLTRQLMIESEAVRCIGSAALDLAWVAAGFADAYTEHGGTHGIKPWDMAAGMLLVAEAGGQVTDESGRSNNLEPAAVVASNGLIHERVREIVAATLPEHLR